MKLIQALLISLLAGTLCHAAETENGPHRRWLDDGKWANSPTDIDYQPDKTTLRISGFSQVYLPAPELEKEKLYLIELDIDASGQIEGIDLLLRSNRNPWTNHGNRFYADVYGKNILLRLQLRMKDSMPAGESGVYLISRGSGVLVINNFILTEIEEFNPQESDSDPVSPQILNGNFSLGASGWNLSGVHIETDSEGKSAVLFANNSKLVSEAILTLHRNINYKLRLRGQGVFNVSLTGLGKDAASANVRANLTKNQWDQDIIIPHNWYGAYSIKGRYYLTVHGNAGALLEEIELGESPARQASFAIPQSVRQQDSCITKDDKIQITLLCQGIPAAETVEVVVQDAYGQEVLKNELKVQSLPETKVTGAEFSFTGTHCGWFQFRLRYGGEFIAGPAAELNVLPPLAQDNGDFVLGAHLFNALPQKTCGQTTFALIDNLERRLTQARHWGVSSSRLHPPASTKWHFVEQQKGIWTFHDEVIDSLVEAGIEVLGLLDGTAKHASTYTERNEENSGHNGWSAYPARDIADWRNYVRKITTHFQGRVKYWEVWNEPDHSFLQLNPDLHDSKVDEYLRLLKAAYEEAKSVDPQLMIVAGAVTAGGRQFILECIDKGMLGYCDVISFHGYGRSTASAHQGVSAFSDFMSSLRSAMADNGKELPVWDSESGNGDIPEGVEGLQKSVNLLKSILVRRAAGLQRFYLYNCFDKAFPGHADHRMMLGYNDRPLILPALCAAYSHMLGDASFASVQEDTDAHIYHFRKPDGRIATAAWSSREKQHVLNDNATGTAYDQFGNPMGKYKNGLVTIGPKLTYYIAE